MTRQKTERWTRLRSVSDTLGDVLATPRGVAPDRDPLAGELRREHR